MNHYETLEVSPSASPEVIRAAYKSLMQRYHPDRNPGDATAAARATRVVQAYEVLSDAAQRAAYDRQLLAGVAAGAMHGETARPVAAGGVRAGDVRRASPAREGRGGRQAVYLVLLVLLGVVVWGALSLKRPSPPVAEAKVSAPPRPAATGAGLEIRALISELTVALKGSGEPATVIYIPALGVRVGSIDPDGAVRHLINSRESLAAKVANRLADAAPDELLKPDGEAYLARLILSALQENEAGGEDKGRDADAGATDLARYGPVGVFFPQGYRVK